MMKKLFGGKKEEEKKEPGPPKLHEMDKETLRETQKGFQKKLNKEIREIEKQIFQIDNLKKKAEENLQKEVKKGDKGDKFIKQTYAKQMVQCNKNKERTLANKYKVQSLVYSLDGVFSSIKMAQIMGSSASLMKEINQCMNIKEMNQTMTELQKEMMQYGMIQEMIDGTMEQMGDGDMDIDNPEEIDNIIKAEEAKIMKKDVQKPDNVVINDPNANKDLDDMEARLQKLMN